MKDKREVECPFCGEGGFDLVGLKIHLTASGWCNVFENLNILSLGGKTIRGER